MAIVICPITYVIRDREAGNEIAKFDHYYEALNALAVYEDEDRRDGTYTPDFYEIVGVEKEEN
jgi:hypothetical protein